MIESIILLPVILILGFLTLFLPCYVYSIHKSAKTQIELLRLNLQAQNNIIGLLNANLEAQNQATKILWDTQHKNQ